ncbi:hypothetical protein GCM10010124_02530 [Pilimelia terevasa]|uniref:Uncharacterized protein n=1 Tax=Pilimelia terevasa TaxID=53372 RepID=A0A8J3FDM7_9ACTN|nr:hypothetical protein GCM10010124_02530 [Pilimelia terevasa]
MSQHEFQAFAVEQVRLAEEALARHMPGGGACCACGRETPCCEAANLFTRREHFAAHLAPGTAQPMRLGVSLPHNPGGHLDPRSR